MANKKAIVQYAGQLSQILDADPLVANAGILRDGVAGGNVSIFTDALTNTISIGRVGQLLHVLGDMTVDGAMIVVGGTTFEGNVQFGDGVGSDYVAFLAEIEGGALAGPNAAILPRDDAGGAREVVFGSTSKRLANLHTEEIDVRSDNTDTEKVLITAASGATQIQYVNATPGTFLVQPADMATSATSGHALKLVGGKGGAASGGFPGGNAGTVDLNGEAGGAGGAGAGETPGTGGRVRILGGAAGADGGVGGADGGQIDITAGAGSGNNLGGSLGLTSGAGGSGNGGGGQVSIAGGTANGAGTGGPVTISGGGTNGTGAGGTVSLVGGQSAGATQGAAVNITGGSCGAATGAGGHVTIKGGQAGTAGAANGGNLYLRGGLPAGAGTSGVVYAGDSQTSAFQIGSGANTCPTTAYGDVVPGADNTFDLGSSSLRWAEGHFGPASLYVRNDNTDTDKLAILFSGAAQADVRLTLPAGGGTLRLGAVTPTTANVAGHGISVVAGDGSAGGTSGIGGAIKVYAGTGGAAGTAKAGVGGTWNGKGGTGGAAGGSNGGVAGGNATLEGGTGGAGTATLAAGGGGVLYLLGGTAGADGTGPGGTGGDVRVDAGSGKVANGDVYLGYNYASKLYFGADAEPAVAGTPTAFGYDIGSASYPFGAAHAQTFRAWDNPGLTKDAIFQYDRVLADGTTAFQFGVDTHPTAATAGAYAYFFAGQGGTATGAGADGGLGGEGLFRGGYGGAGSGADNPGNGGIARVYGGDGGTGGSGNSDGGSVHVRGGSGQGTGKHGSVYLADGTTYNCYLPDAATVSNAVLIGGVDQGATFTGANIKKLHDNSDATGLHYHTGASGSSVDIDATAGEALAVGQPVVFDDDGGGNARVYLADADGAGERKDCCGICSSAAAGSGSSTKVRTSGESTVPNAYWDSVPATSDVGKRVYLSTTAGNLTLTAPSTSGDLMIRVGWLSQGGSGSCKIALGIGEGVTV